MASGFLGALAKARGEVIERQKKEKFADALRVQNEEDRALDAEYKRAQMGEIAARTARAGLPNEVNWDTREGDDAFYQIHPRTGESRRVAGVPMKPRPAAASKKSVDENGLVSLILPDGSTRPVLNKDGTQRRERTPAPRGQRTVGVDPAPIRVVGDQLRRTTTELRKAQSTRALGPLSSRADSTAHRQRQLEIPKLRARADSLSTVYDRMAADQQGQTPDPTAGMSDADAWEYWREQGLTSAQATAKVKSRKGAR